MLFGCYALLGVSVFLAGLMIGLLWFRLIFVDFGPARMTPTLWIVLGVLGQSVTAVGLLGPHAGELVRAPYGEGLEALGVVYGLPVIGFAFAWMAIAAVITLAVPSIAWATALFGLASCWAIWDWLSPARTWGE